MCECGGQLQPPNIFHNMNNINTLVASQPKGEKKIEIYFHSKNIGWRERKCPLVSSQIISIYMIATHQSPCHSIQQSPKPLISPPVCALFGCCWYWRCEEHKKVKSQKNYILCSTSRMGCHCHLAPVSATDAWPELLRTTRLQWIDCFRIKVH